MRLAVDGEIRSNITTAEPDGTLSSGSQTLRDLLEQAILADTVGVDFLGVGEHHRDDYAVSAPEVVLGAIAARTVAPPQELPLGAITAGFVQGSSVSSSFSPVIEASARTVASALTRVSSAGPSLPPSAVFERLRHAHDHDPCPS
mgnify:CR=1 FL=1